MVKQRQVFDPRCAVSLRRLRLTVRPPQDLWVSDPSVSGRKPESTFIGVRQVRDLPRIGGQRRVPDRTLRVSGLCPLTDDS